MSVAPLQDIGAHVKNLIAAYAQDGSNVPAMFIAAGANDNVKVTGESIDRLGFDSCVLTVLAAAALADTETLSLAIEYQTSSDNSTWATAVALQAATTLLTGDTGGTNEKGQVEHDLDLSGLPRYIRFNVTPNLSAGATDTGHFTAVCTLGGAKDSADA